MSPRSPHVAPHRTEGCGRPSDVDAEAGCGNVVVERTVEDLPYRLRRLQPP